MKIKNRKINFAFRISEIIHNETGHEETPKNPILNQLDLSPFSDDTSNPDIDIKDYSN